MTTITEQIVTQLANIIPRWLMILLYEIQIVKIRPDLPLDWFLCGKHFAYISDPTLLKSWGNFYSILLSLIMP